jgi:hypothetical protein
MDELRVKEMAPDELTRAIAEAVRQETQQLRSEVQALRKEPALPSAAAEFPVSRLQQRPASVHPEPSLSL